MDKMSIVVDFIINLGLELIKEKIIDYRYSCEAREQIKKYLERQDKLNKYVLIEEEIDFGGISEYIYNDLIEDIKERCFGNKTERALARDRIITKSRSYALKQNYKSSKKVIKLIADIADILSYYYRSKVNREMLYIAGEIEDLEKEEHSNTRELIQTTGKNLEKSICNNNILSIDSTINQIQVGDIQSAERKLATYMNAISASHSLFPNFGFRMTTENKIASVALTKEAEKLYPTTFKITTSNVKLGNISVKDINIDLLDKAYCSQLPIYMEVKNAKKYLGDVLDPIQTEAEEMIGTTAILKPPEFAEAFPCCVKIAEETVIPYILLRVKKILDDKETVVITNEEQKNFPFRIIINLTPSIPRLTINVRPISPTNKEYLAYKKFLKRTNNAEVSIWLLEENKNFLTGIFNFSTENNLEWEINFFEQIATIEEYFSETITIPKTVTSGDMNVIHRLYNLIKYNVRGSKDTMTFLFDLTDEIRDRFLSLIDQDYSLAYTADGVFSVFDKKFTLPIVREIECVKIKDMERLKEKLKFLDNGDQLKLIYIPGTNKTVCDYVDRIKTEEIDNGLLFYKEYSEE